MVPDYDDAECYELFLPETNNQNFFTNSDKTKINRHFTQNCDQNNIDISKILIPSFHHSLTALGSSSYAQCRKIEALQYNV